MRHFVLLAKLKESWIDLKHANTEEINLQLLKITSHKKADNEIYNETQLELFPKEYRHVLDNQAV